MKAGVVATRTYLLDFDDFALERTVVDLDDGANLHGFGQLRVVGRDAGRVALHGRVSDDHEDLAFLQLDRLALLERACQHRGALSVQHDCQLFLPLREDATQGLQ